MWRIIRLGWAGLGLRNTIKFLRAPLLNIGDKTAYTWLREGQREMVETALVAEINAKNS